MRKEMREGLKGIKKEIKKLKSKRR